jgi:hypothetical protein
MKTITKRKADKLLVESLFNPGGSLTPIKYCTGKYNWLGSQKACIAHYGEKLKEQLAKKDHVKAVWFERRTDSDGVYCQIMCLAQY